MKTQHSDTSAQLLAHRGYAASYPENTFPALAAAVAAGARLIEFDVQLTADRVPILLHDIDFLRTGGRPERIVDVDFAKTLDIEVAERDRFGAQFAGVRAPRLRDIVRHLGEWPAVTAFVELKRQSLEHFGIPVVLDAVLADLAPVLDQCVLISFNSAALVAARQRVHMPVGWALRRYDKEYQKRATTLAPDYLFCNQTRLPPAAYNLWEGNWQWVVYEIIEPHVAEEMFARGVSIVETMAYPEMAKALTDRAGGR